MHASNHVHRSVGVLVQITSITLIDYNRNDCMVNMHFTYITKIPLKVNAVESIVLNSSELILTSLLQMLKMVINVCHQNIVILVHIHLQP